MTRFILDERKMDEICAIISVGCTRSVAAQYVGCHVVTIQRAAQREEKFRRQLARAEAMFEARQLQNINAATQEARHWRASAWLLERKFPERYAKRDAGAITPEQLAILLTQFAEILVRDAPDEFRERILQRLADMKIPVSDDVPKAIGYDG